MCTEFPRKKAGARGDGPDGIQTKLKNTLDRKCAADEVEGRCSVAGHPLPVPSSTSDAAHEDALDPGSYGKKADDGTQSALTHQSHGEARGPPKMSAKYALDMDLLQHCVDVIRWARWPNSRRPWVQGRGICLGLIKSKAGTPTIMMEHI